MKADIIIQIEDEDPYELAKRAKRYEEIFRLLIKTGSLDGIRGGSVNIHFDSTCVFKGIEHNYWPWRERSEK